MATDGKERILDIPLATLHQRVPLVFGSKNQVRTFADDYNNSSIE